MKRRTERLIAIAATGVVGLGIKYWTGYASSTTDAIRNPPYTPGSNSRHKTSASSVVISLP